MNFYFLKRLTYTVLFLIISPNIIFGQNSLNIDSVKTAFETKTNDTTKVNELNDFVWKIKLSHFEDAVEFGEKGYNLAKELDYTKGIAYATKNLGAVYYYRADYGKAIKYYNESLEAFKKAEDRKGIAIALRNIGNVHSQISNYKKALDYYLKSLTIREEIGDKKGVAAVNDAIGSVYASYKPDEFKTPLEYHKKALKINKELANKYGISTSYLYLGSIYYRKFLSDTIQATADTAINYLNKSREICEKINNIRGLTSIDDILGQIYLTQGKYEKALYYFNNSLEIRKQIGNKYGIVSSKINLASYYLEKENLKKSKILLEESLNLAKKIDSKEQIKSIYGNLSGVYYALNDFKKSYETSRKYILLKDSLQNEEKTKEMTQLAMQHEFDKKEKLREIEDKKREELQAEKDKRDKLIKIALTTGVGLMLIIAFTLIRSYRRKVKANNLLQDKNTEITKKNALLNQQKEEIQTQAESLQDAYNEIEKQHQDIKDSIRYAKRIQEAVLPPKEYIDNLLDNYFILFKPRDIVSGDYYWARKKGNKTILIAADCTGHGVPGAFMSLLGISNLNEIVTTLYNEVGENIQAGTILDKLRGSIKSTLRQTGEDGESKDGMDMSVCILDKNEMRMQFAGAQNPLLLVRGNTITKHKADRMPVGIHYGEEKPFRNAIVKVEKGDKIYMLSDGYPDQFGGEKGRKFMMKRFYEVISKHYTKPMVEQKEIFDKIIEDWRKQPDPNGKTYNQIDDILVMGFEI